MANESLVRLRQGLLFELEDDQPSQAELWAMQSEKRALDEMLTATGLLNSSAEYFATLDFIARFRKYSPFNAMLMRLQKPDAIFTLTASRWRSDYGRSIKSDARPLVILQPMGPVMLLFDVSDTDGEPLPQEPFQSKGQVGRELEQLCESCLNDGIRISYVAYGSQMAGAISTAQDKLTLEGKGGELIPLRYELMLSEKISREVAFATLAHELGHLYCGHLGAPDEKWWPDRQGLPQLEREFEAESVAYLLSRRFELETDSQEYLSEYRNSDKPIPAISFECVLQAVSTIDRMARGITRSRVVNKNERK